MGKQRLLWFVLCILVVTSCGRGFSKFTITQVSQVLYDEGLLCSFELNLIEFPNDIEVYPLDADDLCSLDRYDGAHGQIALYPKHSELKRVTQGLAETMNKGPLSYSEFVKGNIVITIFPELAEEDAERFRHALESLE